MGAEQQRFTTALTRALSPGRGRSIRRVVGKIKCVLRIAGGMVGGRVERVETMILVLDFRAVGDDEADFAEAADDVLGHLRERMEFAKRAAASGQREIGRFLGQRSRQFEFGAAFGQRGFEGDFGSVDGFAGSGLFLLRKRAELFHQSGEPAVRANPVALGLFERGEVGRGFQVGQRGLFQRFNFVKKSGHKFPERLATKGRKEHEENSGSRGGSPHQHLVHKSKTGGLFQAARSLLQIEVCFMLSPKRRRVWLSARFWQR